MKKLPLLGNLSPRQFLEEYWQKKPLLIRQAIPGFQPIASRDTLFEMAASEDIESRLIVKGADAWRMERGPIETLPKIAQKAWTLLVQGVDLHLDAGHELLQQFRFIPDARLDDLMISYASDEGGVGPHFDSYDVFLLQAQGKRRWQISAQKDLTLVDNLPLKILKNFVAEEEYVLEPGDMLYLPPHYAHDGVAIGECMTYSIGFRAPSFQEFGESLLQFMAETIELPGRYTDSTLQPATRPAEISVQMLDRFEQEMEKIRFTREDVLIHLGEFLTEPKPTVFFDTPTRPTPLSRFAQLAAKHGVKLARQTRMLYRQRHVFINGDSFYVEVADRKPLAMLADQRQLPQSACANLSSDLLEALHSWHEDGWLRIPS